MWIAELLDNRWSDSVTVEMYTFEEETKGDGILQWYVFLHENIGHAKEAIIAAPLCRNLLVNNHKQDHGTPVVQQRLLLT